MLVPREERSMESDRLTSAQRTEVSRSASSVQPSLAIGLAMGFMSRTIGRAMTRRKTHHLHFIRARDAMYHRRRMPRPDLNLLVTLNVLLAEGNVARAARRL